MPFNLKDTSGTSQFSYQIGKAGSKLDNVAGTIYFRDDPGTSQVDIVAKILKASSNQMILNSEAAGVGADWTLSFERPSTGMTQNVVLKFPEAVGSPGQVLYIVSESPTGTMNLGWTTIAGATNTLKADTTSLTFGSGSTISMFTLPAAAIVLNVLVFVDTIFDGSGPTPSASIGISGSAAKYMPATAIDLTTAGSYESRPNLTAQGAEAMEIAFTAGGGASAGAARVIVIYVEPS